jgi:hypothetical protein
MSRATMPGFGAGRRRTASLMQPPPPTPINRELSQLAFNRRVLALAQDDACRCSSGCVPLHRRQQPR